MSSAGHACGKHTKAGMCMAGGASVPANGWGTSGTGLSGFDRDYIIRIGYACGRIWIGGGIGGGDLRGVVNHAWTSLVS